MRGHYSLEVGGCCACASSCLPDQLLTWRFEDGRTSSRRGAWRANEITWACVATEQMKIQWLLRGDDSSDHDPL